VSGSKGTFCEPDHETWIVGLAYDCHWQYLSAVLVFFYEFKVEILSDESVDDFEAVLSEGLAETDAFTSVEWTKAHGVTFLSRGSL